MAESGGALGRALSPLFALSWLVSRAMAALCCALLAFIAAAIVYDVTVRNLGLQPPNFTVSFTEYVLIIEELSGAEIEIDEAIVEKVRTLRGVADNFF